MDPFTRIKSVLAIVLGLSLAHLIQASLNLLLQRGKKKPYWVQMLWVFYVFLLILHFWWWEYNLTGIKVFPEPPPISAISSEICGGLFVH